MNINLINTMATAIDMEIDRQYRTTEGERWDDAKEVLENLDYSDVARKALAAFSAWTTRQIEP